MDMVALAGVPKLYERMLLSVMMEITLKYARVAYSGNKCNDLKTLGKSEKGNMVMTPRTTTTLIWKRR
jgi:hypothetical protein